MYILFQRFIAFFLLIMLLPFFFILFIVVETDSEGPFIFKQKRLGKDKKNFEIYKIRTMVKNAEKIKGKYRKINEADGPVFKIYDDPRYTRVGKILAHSGLDELPQLLNIIKGEMVFVGPRPLPVDEAKRIPEEFEKRFRVLPGITSSWVVEGSHDLKFLQWMRLDLEYIKKHSIFVDLKIILATAWIIVRTVVLHLLNKT